MNARVVVFDLLSAVSGPARAGRRFEPRRVQLGCRERPGRLRRGAGARRSRAAPSREHGQTFAEVAYPARRRPSILLTAPLHDQLQTVSRRARACLRRRRARDRLRGRPRLRGREPLRAADPAPRGRRRADRRRAVRRGGRRLAARTSSASSPGPSSGCACGSRDLDRARGEFIANASHELRTPLFSLGGFLELLDDPSVDDATREEFLAQMREQVTRLTKLATDLLDLSRVDAGRLTVSQEVGRPGRARRRARRRVRPRARRGGHPLEVVPASRPCSRSRDAERVLQIGRVLVENALVHTPAGTTVRGLDRARRRPGDPDGRGRRPGDPGGRPAADLRAVLPPRRHARLRARVSGSRSPASWPS